MPKTEFGLRKQKSLKIQRKKPVQIEDMLGCKNIATTLFHKTEYGL